MNFWLKVSLGIIIAFIIFIVYVVKKLREDGGGSGGIISTIKDFCGQCKKIFS